MGKFFRPIPVKLFTGIIAASPELVREVEPLLTAAWGPIDHRSPLLPFDHTEFYRAEMGEQLLRQWVSFEKLADPGSLAACKLASNEMEKAFAVTGQRRVNIDPGYLTMAKLVLASCKDFSHRVYLSDGVYGEVTLLFRHHEFITLPWTYPDYAGAPAFAFFKEVRSTFHEQLQQIPLEEARRMNLKKRFK